MEVAKNTILAGVKKVALYDPTPTTSWDLGGNFYLTEVSLYRVRVLRCCFSRRIQQARFCRTTGIVSSPWQDFGPAFVDLLYLIYLCSNAITVN